MVQQAADFGVKPLQQVVESKGSESPTPTGWSSRNHRARHDLSRARLRAIECSLENGHVWVPPFIPNRKTWEEEVSLLFLFFVRHAALDKIGICRLFSGIFML